MKSFILVLALAISAASLFGAGSGATPAGDHGACAFQKEPFANGGAVTIQWYAGTGYKFTTVTKSSVVGQFANHKNALACTGSQAYFVTADDVVWVAYPTGSYAASQVFHPGFSYLIDKNLLFYQGGGLVATQDDRIVVTGRFQDKSGAVSTLGVDATNPSSMTVSANFGNTVTAICATSKSIIGVVILPFASASGVVIQAADNDSAHNTPIDVVQNLDDFALGCGKTTGGIISNNGTPKVTTQSENAPTSMVTAKEAALANSLAVTETSSVFAAPAKFANVPPEVAAIGPSTQIFKVKDGTVTSLDLIPAGNVEVLAVGEEVWLGMRTPTGYTFFLPRK